MVEKCMRKFMLIMMKLIILIVLEVYANDLTPLSLVPTPLPANIDTFQPDNCQKTHIHCCLESILRVCEKVPVMFHLEWCIADTLLPCIFENPIIHPRKRDAIKRKSVPFCVLEEAAQGISLASCLANCYERYIEEH